MLNLLFDKTEPYNNFTPEHWWALILFSLFIYAIVKWSIKGLSAKNKQSIFILLSFIPLAALLLRTIMDYSVRELSLQEDLPLHLCRVLSLVAPVIVLWGKQKPLKVFYILVLAGVTNAMITADIVYGFPHYGYFLYWIYHGSLVLLAFYGILVFRTRLNLKDGLIAFISVNVYFFFVHLLNVALEANYMYSRFKPERKSVMDLLGEWPTYLLWLEVMAFLLILIILFIFEAGIIRTKKKSIKD